MFGLQCVDNFSVLVFYTSHDVRFGEFHNIGSTDIWIVCQEVVIFSIQRILHLQLFGFGIDVPIDFRIDVEKPAIASSDTPMTTKNFAWSIPSKISECRICPRITTFSISTVGNSITWNCMIQTPVSFRYTRHTLQHPQLHAKYP